jgi:uncharacterized membrane-anchored protein
LPAKTRREPIAPKVPEVTLLFWLAKIVATGMGEATSDYLGEISTVLSASVGLIGLALAIWLQFRVRKYVAPAYWFLVVMIAIVGTAFADGVHSKLHLPYIGTTALYAACLALVFFLWQRSEGTLSIHSITTRRREIYYWLAVASTFALGTAMGDLAASSFGLGFFPSGIIFAILIVIPAIAWWRLKTHEVAIFWWAYVLTRPLGASFADWFGKPHSSGGLGLGDGTVSGIATIGVIVLVAYLAHTKRDIQAGHGAEILEIRQSDDGDDDEIQTYG